MRKTDATIRARIESNRDQVPVELWSRAPMMNGEPIPRIARTWILLNPMKFGNDDQAIAKQRAEFEGRGFRLEKTVSEVKEGGQA